MNALLLAALTAPEPSPAIGVDVATGQAGEWFGPLFVLALAVALDWSALGSNALRDRIAALGYYSATVSIISIYSWSDEVQGWFGGSWSWKITGSAIAAGVHLALVLVMIGTRFKWSAAVAGWIANTIHIDSADSKAQRINTTLLTASVIAGASSVLARGFIGGRVHDLATVITGLWSAIANLVINLLGG